MSPIFVGAPATFALDTFFPAPVPIVSGSAGIAWQYRVRVRSTRQNRRNTTFSLLVGHSGSFSSLAQGRLSFPVLSALLSPLLHFVCITLENCGTESITGQNQSRDRINHGTESITEQNTHNRLQDRCDHGTESIKG